MEKTKNGILVETDVLNHVAIQDLIHKFVPKTARLIVTAKKGTKEMIMDNVYKNVKVEYTFIY